MLEEPEVGLGAPEGQEGLVEVVGEALGAPRSRVVRRHDHRETLRHEASGGVVPQVIHQVQHLRKIDGFTVMEIYHDEHYVRVQIHKLPMSAIQQTSCFRFGY